VTVALLALFTSLLGYEAATHAALSEHAAWASRLDGALRSWGLDGGLRAELRLPLSRLSRQQAFAERERLARVDPAWGGAVDERDAMRALGWLIAGSVLEEAPASRGRHHFLDPRDGSGLIQPRPGLEWLLSAIAGADGEGGLAGALVGTNFAMLGEPADRWVTSAANEWSVDAFYRELRDAVLSPEPWQREGAMARALLALGSVAHVLQDMASPTHVRNDLVEGHLGRIAPPPSGSTFDRSSPYERFVALAYAVPPPPEPTPPPTGLRDRFRSLAARTQREFFSPGTLPRAVPLTRGMSTGAAARLAMADAPYREPVPAGLDFRRPAGYTTAAGVAHLAGYHVDPTGTLRFGLDDHCWADYARVLLPRAAGATVGLLDDLAPPGPEIRVEGGTVALVSRDLRSAQVVFFWEDASGKRAELPRTADGAAVSFPSGAVRVGVLFDGKDAQGERLVTARVVRP
jgi:hypothetical protein